MNPNVLILSIDSLRSDRIFGKNKSAFTPNLDKIIENGIYFKQAISTADATGLSLGSLATAKYSFRTGSTQFGINPDMFTYFQLFKNFDYNTYATVPDLSFFLKLTKFFTESDPYTYFKRESWLRLAGGIGKSILNRIEQKNKKPWIYFIHLMDLHAPFYIPREFDSEKFGKTPYDRMISSIDSWIGNLFEVIDSENTLVIVTADHGDHIPVVENWGKPVKVNLMLKKFKEKFPAFESVGVRILNQYSTLKQKKQMNKLKKNLTEKQLQALLGRSQNVLYDELINIPLIFYGYGIKKPKIISNQVRQVDILPTIADILQVSNPEDVDGRSLLPLINDVHLEELPAYIETGIRVIKEKNTKIPKKEGKIFGIRTSKYKYWRSRYDPKQDVTLFDLKEDPDEEKNIADKNPSIVSEMEDILISIKKTPNSTSQNHFSSDEEKMIEDELRKLGYL